MKYILEHVQVLTKHSDLTSYFPVLVCVNITQDLGRLDHISKYITKIYEVRNMKKYEKYEEDEICMT